MGVCPPSQGHREPQERGTGSGKEQACPPQPHRTTPATGLVSAPQSAQTSLPPAAASGGHRFLLPPAPHFAVGSPGARCGGGAARCSRPGRGATPHRLPAAAAPGGEHRVTGPVPPLKHTAGRVGASRAPASPGETAVPGAGPGPGAVAGGAGWPVPAPGSVTHSRAGDKSPSRDGAPRGLARPGPRDAPHPAPRAVSARRHRGPSQQRDRDAAPPGRNNRLRPPAAPRSRSLWRRVPPRLPARPSRESPQRQRRHLGVPRTPEAAVTHFRPRGLGLPVIPGAARYRGAARYPPGAAHYPPLPLPPGLPIPPSGLPITPPPVTPPSPPELPAGQDGGSPVPRPTGTLSPAAAASGGHPTPSCELSGSQTS